MADAFEGSTFQSDAFECGDVYVGLEADIICRVGGAGNYGPIGYTQRVPIDGPPADIEEIMTAAAQEARE